MPAFIWVFVVVYCSIYLTSPIIIFFHELGHAIAYLILTKQNQIDVFIGSYGDKETKLKFRIGNLFFYIKYGFPLVKYRGQCQADTFVTNYFKEIAILLAGSFLSLLIAGILCLFAFEFEMHGAIKLYVFALIVWSSASLIINLFPLTFRGGRDSDGRQIFFATRIKKFYNEYATACNAQLNGDYAAATVNLQHLTAVYPKEEKILRQLITALLLLKNFEEAKNYYAQLKMRFELNANDYINFGYLNYRAAEKNLAIDSYKKGLELDPNNLVGLNNLAYQYTLSGEYEQAYELLNKAIEIDPGYSFSYNNLGYLKILAGHSEEGKSLIEKSIEMHSNNSYAYMHLGVYYLKIYDKKQAQANFQKALELDDKVVLENYMQELESMPDNIE
ncbi:MAG TPA: tetratricopeptide repeat protein [Mucilaginibacter sp.]|nr:tetratricopeptide repeat protein [Mucilaginibacter sp.]